MFVPILESFDYFRRKQDVNWMFGLRNRMGCLAATKKPS